MAKQYVMGSYYRIVQERKPQRKPTMTPQQAEEWHLPYFGPTVEDCDEADALGDYQYETYRQQEIDRDPTPTATA